MAGLKTVCNTCGGSGEIGYFQGESRFFITREECPACLGVGYTELDEAQPETPAGECPDKGKAKAKPRRK